jgi:polysaccharide export outer membrane protein
MSRHWILVVRLGVIFLAATGAQAPTVAAQDASPQPAFVNLSKASNDYQVGPGDLLDIQVVEHPELTQTLRISNSGEISMSPVGLICVADLTAFDVEYAIAETLREMSLIRNPEVLVFIAEYQAKPIYVSGAVVNPGEFIMSQELTVADAILLAGGLQFNAASEGLIHRRVTGNTQHGLADSCAETYEATSRTETIKVDLQPMKEGRFFEAALPLKRGDVIVVPQIRMNPYFTAGELVNPYNYFYPPGQTLTVSQAISAAGGPLPTAKMSDGILVRYDEQGRRTEMKVDYAAILTGKQPDFAIQPNDIIFVPGSTIKTLAHGTLLMTDHMAMSAVFRVGRRMQLPERPTSVTQEPH